MTRESLSVSSSEGAPDVVGASRPGVDETLDEGIVRAHPEAPVIAPQMNRVIPQ